MTHVIPTEEAPKEEAEVSIAAPDPESAKRELINSLENHLKLVSKYLDEKHSHKRNVLVAAIDLLENRIDTAKFNTIKENNPM